MQFTTISHNLSQIVTDCLIVPITSKPQLSPLAKQVNQSANNIISITQQIGDLTHKPCQTMLIPAPLGLTAKRLLLINIGEQEKLLYRDFKKMLSTIYQQLSATSSHSACLVLDKITVQNHDALWTLRHACQMLAKLHYSFDTYKSKPQAVTLQNISFYTAKPQQIAANKALASATALINGINFCKDLGNTPCNIAIPSYLAKQAQQLAKQFKNINCKIHGEAELKRLKMGAILAVGAGSQHESQLIEMHYQGGKKSQAPIVLVGKGVTFDSGGISIKPGPGMEEMKYDMCGAATVLGTLCAAAAMKLPLNIIGIIPSAENMPSGNSYKPGDVITSMSGQTIEILNTDAEGRLLLCDALTYAKRFKPQVLIDIATLTGAMVVALGTSTSGFFTDDEALAKQLSTAAVNSEDDAWRMPLRETFLRETDSKVADMRNVGSRWGGASIAAGFLSRFVDPEQSWVHMDIAGISYEMGNSVGATGRPIPLLIEFLQQLTHAKR